MITILNLENIQVKPKRRLKFKSSVYCTDSKWELIKTKLEVTNWNKLIIIKVVINNNKNITFNIIKTQVNTNINVFTISYDKIFNVQNPIMDWIIHNNSCLENTIFIFENQIWENIQILFENSGTKVYGGNIESRHMLSSCQFTLSKFINIINN
jgi:hypothetical protein